MEVGRGKGQTGRNGDPLWRRKEARPLPAREGGGGTGSDLRRGLERADAFWAQEDEVS